MKTRILSRDDLRPLTTVPQCTDNQFVPREFFGQIAGKTPLKNVLADFLEPESQRNRLFSGYRQKAQTEYKRSLLYSNQVVLNRSAFWNTPPLISSALGTDRNGLTTLLAESTIVPFLYNETAFEQEPKFDILPHGEEAVRSLVKDPSLAEIKCVRLGGTDADEHKRSVKAFTIDFRQQLTQLLDADNVRETSLEIANVLLGRAGSDVPDSADTAALAEKLERVGKWVRDNKPTRNEIYQNFITLGPPSDGLYSEEPLTFEVKLWVDLIYNSNLPRHLGVLTFVPSDFPTPLDVGLTWALAGKSGPKLELEKSGALGDIVDRARTQATWKAWDVIQKTANLSIPSPDALSHLDVVTLRGWDEWKAMMKAMEIYVDAPLNEENAKEFHKSYDGFLKKLSVWWLERNADARTEWASGVAKVYRYGKWFVGLLVIAGHTFPILPPHDVHLPTLPSEQTVKVVVETGLYLFQRARTDWRRTQLVRSMSRQHSLRHDELVAAWKAIQKLYPELPREYPGHDFSRLLATEEG